MALDGRADPRPTSCLAGPSGQPPGPRGSRRRRPPRPGPALALPSPALPAVASDSDAGKPDHPASTTRTAPPAPNLQYVPRVSASVLADLPAAPAFAAASIHDAVSCPELRRRLRPSQLTSPWPQANSSHSPQRVGLRQGSRQRHRRCAGHPPTVSAPSWPTSSVLPSSPTRTSSDASRRSPQIRMLR